MFGISCVLLHRHSTQQTLSPSFLISRKLPTFNFFFCLYTSGFCFFFFFFVKLRGLSNRSSSMLLNHLLYLHFFFLLYNRLCLFSDMNYFVYFICLLCLTGLITTMPDSYNVSETLNNFIKTPGLLCSLSHGSFHFSAIQGCKIVLNSDTANFNIVPIPREYRVSTAGTNTGTFNI